jgi:hypothetical protein
VQAVNLGLELLHRAKHVPVPETGWKQKKKMSRDERLKGVLKGVLELSVQKECLIGVLE